MDKRLMKIWFRNPETFKFEPETITLKKVRESRNSQVVFTELTHPYTRKKMEHKMRALTWNVLHASNN